jgi:hypothetical protein
MGDCCAIVGHAEHVSAEGRNFLHPAGEKVASGQTAG